LGRAKLGAVRTCQSSRNSYTRSSVNGIPSSNPASREKPRTGDRPSAGAPAVPRIRRLDKRWMSKRRSESRAAQRRTFGTRAASSVRSPLSTESVGRAGRWPSAPPLAALARLASRSGNGLRLRVRRARAGRLRRREGTATLRSLRGTRPDRVRVRLGLGLGSGLGSLRGTRPDRVRVRLGLGLGSGLGSLRGTRPDSGGNG
jgi:hypothetical protein